jgi:GNAT superfamily N-acetyltransferase
VTEITWGRFFDGAEPVHALAAEEGLIGFVHYLFHRSTAKAGPICYLQDMFTVEAARGRGVGRALVEGVCAWLGLRERAASTGTHKRAIRRPARSTTRSQHSRVSSNIANTCESSNQTCGPVRNSRLLERSGPQPIGSGVELSAR